MGNHARPIKTKCFEKFLLSKSCTYTEPHKSSHGKWYCPGCFRPLIYRPAKKEIPSFHIESNLKTLGIPKEEFWNWVEENC